MIISDARPSVIVMGEYKRMGIAAHNNKKRELIECLRKHRDVLAKHKLYAAGYHTDSIAEKITKIFFVYPLDAHAHDVDNNVYGIVCDITMATVDFMYT